MCKPGNSMAKYSNLPRSGFCSKVLLKGAQTDPQLSQTVHKRLVSYR